VANSITASQMATGAITIGMVTGTGNLVTLNRANLLYTDGADVTANNTANNAANYTGSAISTSYTAAKCTNANADQTSVNTSYDTARVNALASTTLISG